MEKTLTEVEIRIKERNGEDLVESRYIFMKPEKLKQIQQDKGLLGKLLRSEE